MDIRITCSNLTAGMFQTGVFEAFHNISRVGNLFEAPDPSDQSDYFLVLQNKQAFEICAQQFFCFQGWIFLCLRSKTSQPGPREQLPGVFLDSPGPLEPSSSTLAVSRRGQGR